MTANPAAFHALGSDGSATHGELPLALAGQFAEVDLDPMEVRISALSRRLSGSHGRSTWGQLEFIRDVLAGALTICTSGQPVLDDLLFDRTVIDGHGHPLACALVAIEAARRAGIELGLVASARHIALALRDHTEADVILPGARWTIVDARRLGDPDMTWMCAHRCASVWLVLLRQVALSHHCAPAAVRAIDLQLGLPLAPRDRTRLAGIRREIVTREPWTADDFGQTTHVPGATAMEVACPIWVRAARV